MSNLTADKQPVVERLRAKYPAYKVTEAADLIEQLDMQLTAILKKQQDDCND